MHWLQGVHLLRVQCILPGVESRSELAVPQRDRFLPILRQENNDEKTKKQPHSWMTVYDLKQSLASHSRSPERMMQSRMISDAILRNKYRASHTKIDFGLQLLATNVHLPNNFFIYNYLSCVWLAVTLPVTSASYERSFSKMKLAWQQA